MNMAEKEGMRVFQAHLPVSLNKKLTETCFRLNTSKSEIARQAIELFLKTLSSKCGDTKNDNN